MHGLVFQRKVQDDYGRTRIYRKSVLAPCVHEAELTMGPDWQLALGWLQNQRFRKERPKDIDRESACQQNAIRAMEDAESLP